MKKALSVILLSLFLFSTSGYYILYSVLDSCNRNEIQSRLFHETCLKEIRIHKSEINSVIFKDKGKEIFYAGEMYDVKSQSSDGNYIIFHCKQDKQETLLLAGLDKHVKNNSDSNSPDKKESKSPVKDLFFLEKSISFLSSTPFEFQPYIVHRTSYIASPLPLPPPEVSLS